MPQQQHLATTCHNLPQLARKPSLSFHFQSCSFWAPLKADNSGEPHGTKLILVPAWSQVGIGQNLALRSLRGLRGSVLPPLGLWSPGECAWAPWVSAFSQLSKYGDNCYFRGYFGGVKKKTCRKGTSTLPWHLAGIWFDKRRLWLWNHQLHCRMKKNG